MIAKLFILIKTRGLLGATQAVLTKVKKAALFPVISIISGTPYSKTLLATWGLPKERGTFGRLIFDQFIHHWMETEYWKEPDPDERVRKQELLMGGKAGRTWAMEYDSRDFELEQNGALGNLPYRVAIPAFTWLEDLLVRLPAVSVCEVGSSAGRKMAYFSSKFEKHEFIGTDIYPEVVEYSSQSHQSPNLQFVTCAAKDLLGVLLNTRHSEVVLLSTGSLQYVQPEHISALMKTLAKEMKAAGKTLHLLFSEPGNETNGSPYENQKSTPRGNLSWNHNYLKLAESNGFEVITAEIIRPYVPYEQFWPNYQGTVICALRACLASRK